VSRADIRGLSISFVEEKLSTCIMEEEKDDNEKLLLVYTGMQNTNLMILSRR
jgi:hypothetical protein